MALGPIEAKRCRAIVLWTGAAFALMQLALGLAVDRSLPEVRDPEFAFREALLEKQLSHENNKKPLVVMMGSSRVLNGLDGETTTKALDGRALVFNFGIPSSGPFLERVCLERLLADGVKPDLLLVEVLPAFFNGNSAPLDRNDLDGARLSAEEISKVAPTLANLAGPIRRWAVGRALPSYRHQAELRGLLGIDRRSARDGLPQELRAIDPFGWQPRGYDRPEEQTSLTALAHHQYDECYRDFRLSSEQVTQLRELLSRCKKESIRTVLVLTPEGSEFRELYGGQMNAAIDDMLNGLRAEFGVSVVDARAWLDDTRFFDMHHLRWEGARRFSDRLTKECIAPMLANPPPGSNERQRVSVGEPIALQFGATVDDVW